MKLKNHFKIIIPIYNCENWVKNCILSIQKQNYENFECIILDDLSTDNTVSLINKYTKNDKRFKLIINQEKKYALRNIVEGIELIKPEDEDIIITLDGDDWFASSDVLNTLNEKYQEKKSLMTYGSYIEYPAGVKGKFSKKIPDEIIKNNDFRNYEWCSSHLRTFKYKLWKKIDIKDLLDEDGNYYKMAWDLSFMFPMLEMSGKNSLFIDKILYVYNLQNPINDHKVNAHLQQKLELFIRKKNKYSLINF